MDTVNCNLCHDKGVEMTELITPNLPGDHPLSMYVSNLRSGSSVSWFSETAGVNDLRDYVWGLMNLRHDEVYYKREGFAEAANEAVLFVGAESSSGAILTCFPLDDIGAALVNGAVSDQWGKAMEEMRRGQFQGFPVQHYNAMIRHGEVIVESFHFAKGEIAIDIINTATVVPLSNL
jgi:hypothetical protein